MLLVELLPSIDLNRLLKEIVVVHQLEVLQVVSMSLAHAISPVSHHSEEDLSLQVWGHQHLEVVSLDVV